jgi:hypothetical protein
MSGLIRLRARRTVYARRRTGRRRLTVVGGTFVLLIGAACLAPLAVPAALAPAAAPEAQSQPLQAEAPLLAVATPTPVSRAPGAGATLLVPAPTVQPTPVVIPTLTASGENVLNAIKSDRTAQWVRNHTETPLRSGPTDEGIVFTQLPQWTLLKQTGTRPGWLMVQYSGDGDTRQAGPGWVKASDVGGVDPPSIWVGAAKAGTLWSAWDASGQRKLDLPANTVMEVMSGADFISGTRLHVRLPGDGRTVPPAEGWVDGDTIARTATPSLAELPRAFPEDLSADVRVNVPYRSQLDGSDYASANCGPTVLGMALESFGVNLTPPDLRGQVLDTENFSPDDTDAGSYIWALADVAASDGVRTHGLYDDDGSLHHWSMDDIRASLRNHQPVILQVIYRALPGREDSGYYGDHYIIITGLLGDNFLYNDPIGGAVAHEVPGYDRFMTPTQLQKAMHASDTPYAYSGFALSR